MATDTVNQQTPQQTIQEKLYETMHANLDSLWDAIALLDGALSHEDMEDKAGAQRIVRLAQEKLREFDNAVSLVI